MTDSGRGALKASAGRARAPGWPPAFAALVAVFLASALWLPGSAAANGNSARPRRVSGRYVAGELLVRFAPGVSSASIDALNARIGARTIQAYHMVPNLRLIGLPKDLDVTGGIAAYKNSAGVLYAERDFITHIADTVPNDPSFNLQWDWQNTGQLGGTPGDDVDAPKAWDITTGSNTVAVGLLDTGVQIDPHVHLDLAANVWTNQAECNGLPGVDDDGDGYIDDCHGYDMINGDGDPDDDNGHGTHTAGTMGAVGNNSLGVTGMNWHVTIVPCKSHDQLGNGTEDAVIGCLQFMSDQKARGLNIVATNNSYAHCPEACDYSQALYDAIKAQIDSGILYVAAAGNDGSNNDTSPVYPTNYFLPNVIGVAATTNTDTLASFSNYGLHTVYLGAPGQSIYSTYTTSTTKDIYAYLSGTSMASPHVAGLAALLAAHNPSLDWRGIRNLILAGGEVISSLQGKTVTGRRMNAYGSLTCSNVPVFAPLRPLPGAVGGTQPLAGLNIDCASPAGGLTVTVTPGNKTYKLRDDGLGQDLAAGDGIYSAAWTPCADGTFTLSYSNGSTDTVTVTGLTPCITAKPPSGPPGSTTTVKGRGFSSSETVTITFDDTVVGTATADGTGRLSTVITVPAGSTQGRHTITATGATSNLPTQASFRVT